MVDEWPDLDTLENYDSDQLNEEWARTEAIFDSLNNNDECGTDNFKNIGNGHVEKQSSNISAIHHVKSEVSRKRKKYSKEKTRYKKPKNMPWCSESRVKIMKQIASVLEHRKNPPENWCTLIPSLADRLETLLYIRATNFDEYINLNTLNERVRDLSVRALMEKHDDEILPL